MNYIDRDYYSGPESCVYFLQAGGLTKIGKAREFERRLLKLENMYYPRGARGLGKITGAYRILTPSPTYLERQLHLLFEQEQVKGEWFFLRKNEIDALKDIFKSTMTHFERRLKNPPNMSEKNVIIYVQINDAEGENLQSRWLRPERIVDPSKRPTM